MKLFRGHLYQERFADHIQIFSQRRSELQLISADMMGGIDTANLVTQTLGSVDYILERNGGSKEDRRGQTVEQATG